MNLITAALNQQVSARRSTSLPVKAHAELEEKTHFLNRLWQESDPLTVLNIGKSVRDVSYDPIWNLSLKSQSPERLLRGWERFEKYAHSNNRVRFSDLSGEGVTCTRYSIGGRAPSAAENHLICGILSALLHQIGCAELQCHARSLEGEEHLLFSKGHFLETANEIPFLLAAWRFTWGAHQAAIREEEVSADWEPDFLPSATPGAARQIVRRAFHVIRSDIAYPWKLDELANSLGLSMRSLQRRLQEAGLSFSALIRLSRVFEASHLLQHSATPITAIGFCTGFSDSSHFAREFRASTGMTPTEYRAGVQNSQD